MAGRANLASKQSLKTENGRDENPGRFLMNRGIGSVSSELFERFSLPLCPLRLVPSEGTQPRSKD